MFRVKICGVTTPEDAAHAVRAGADAVGLNFYAKSKRSVDASVARAVREAADGALAIGVFVNASAEEITRTVDLVRLSAVQLHGDEPPSFLAELPVSLPIVRAVRVDTDVIDRLTDDLKACEQAGRRPDALLVDAAATNAYGGTGKTVDWSSLAGAGGSIGGTPLILAGGLNASKVAEAIRVAQPYGVDVASGVESSPGVKDATKMRAFVQEIQNARHGSAGGSRTDF